MPTHIRAHVQWQVGSALPRDVMQITPCFRAQTPMLPTDTANWTTLADDIRNIFAGSWTDKATNQMTVKLYDIEGTDKPNRPRATSVKYAGQAAEASAMREIALCLSFYGGPNGPSNRGRLYIPAWLFLAGSVPVRPTQANRDKVAELPALLSAVGGTNIDWGVWSTTRDQFTKVDHWFVDDEWDVQRRRGLKPSARSAGTTGG